MLSTETVEAVEMTWVPDCQRVAIRNSRQDQPGDPCVLVTPAAVEAFIGRVRAGDYGTGTEPPPRTVPLSDTLGDRQVLRSLPAGGDIEQPKPPVGPLPGPISQEERDAAPNDF